MEILNFENLKIKARKDGNSYGKEYFETVVYAIDRINKYITKKGKIQPRQEGEYEILTFAMKNEVNADALIYAVQLSWDEIEKAREIIIK